MPAVPGDEELPVAAARAGDPAAWDALFRRYQLPLYVYAVELTHNEQAALDAVQEAFISAARHLGSLRDDRKFGSWLFSIAHQKCAQHWRRAEPTEPWPEQDEDLVALDESPGSLLLRREQEEEFMKLLHQLSDPHRSVLLLHYLEEFSLEDIAAVTGASVGTVKSRLHYARKALRDLLAERTT